MRVKSHKECLFHTGDASGALSKGATGKALREAVGSSRKDTASIARAIRCQSSDSRVFFCGGANLELRCIVHRVGANRLPAKALHDYTPRRWPFSMAVECSAACLSAVGNSAAGGGEG